MTTTESMAGSKKSATRMPTKELTALQRRLKQGWKFERTGGGHYRVRDRRGNLVQYKGTNITFSGTPSPGVLRALEEQLTEARALVGTEQVERSAEEMAVMREQAKRAFAIRDKAREIEAKELLARFRSTFSFLKLDTPGLRTDLGRVAAYLLRGSPREGMTPDLLAQSVTRVLSGGWVEPRYQEVWARLLDRLDDSPDRPGEWYTLLREARGLPADSVQVRLPKNAQDDWPFRVELIPLDATFADEAYQRPPNWAAIRKEAARFDPTLISTIDVSQRSPSRFAILDGQQRVEMIRLVGKSTVWASVYAGMDLASEARFFLKRNRDRKAVHPYYTFRAQLTSGDPLAVAVNEIVEKHGYRFSIGAPAPGGATENNIAAIAGVLKAYERKLPDGTTALDPTLSVLKRSTLGRPHGQDTMMIRGVALLFERRNGEIDHGQLVDLIAALGPDLILGRARDSRGGGRTNEEAVTDVLSVEYDRRRRRRRAK